MKVKTMLIIETFAEVVQTEEDYEFILDLEDIKKTLSEPKTIEVIG